VIQALVEKITLRAGPNRGEIDATLHGKLGTILGGSKHKASERLGNANSRSFRYGSVGIRGCGDTQHPILAIG
jgi:hypothetical protein